jgi:ArsR family transcriptional regulator
MMTSVDTGLIRALADPLRLRIVTLLAKETLCTTHLVEETGARQTNLSNHLRVLREAGVVVSERRGSNIHYWLAPDLRERMGRIAQGIVPGGLASADSLTTARAPSPKATTPA